MQNFVQKVRNKKIKDFEKELEDAVSFWHTEYLGAKTLYEFLGIHLEHYSSFLKDNDFEKTIKESPLYE